MTTSSFPRICGAHRYADQVGASLVWLGVRSALIGILFGFCIVLGFCVMVRFWLSLSVESPIH